MSKRYSKGKKQAKSDELDPFGLPEGGVEEAEPSEPVEAKEVQESEPTEAIAEEVDPGPTEVDSEPEDASETVISEPEEVSEPIAADAAEEPEEEPEATVEDERRKHEKGLRDEITRLRGQIRETRAHEALVRAPAPIPQPPIPPAVTEVTPSAGGVPVKFDKDGQPYIDRALLQQEVAQAIPKPDPQQVAAQHFEQARQQWVAEDPAVHGPAAQRIEGAVEYLNLLSEKYVAETGNSPQGFQGWVDTIERSGIGEAFRGQFPEIQDVGGFVHAMMLGTQDPGERAWKARNYMRRYIDGQSVVADDSGEAEGDPPRKVSNVVKLAHKPRSMATKGKGTPSATTDAQRFEKLVEEQAASPFTTDHLQEETTALARKLNIPGY